MQSEKLNRGLKHTGQRTTQKGRLKLKRPTEERTKLKKEESVGKASASKVNNNLEKKLLKKPLWLEDENLLKQTGRSTKYANTRLPADPCCQLKPKYTNTTHCI